MVNVKRISVMGILMLSMSACTQSQVDRLEMVGKEPPLQQMHNPQEQVAPMHWPATAGTKMNHQRALNSLWSSNSHEFFKDHRARNIGDILTVKIQIQDKAELDNKTERKRTNSDQMGVDALFGLEGKLTKFLPGDQNPAALIGTNGSMDNAGEGVIEREEVIETEVAAVVTQILPGGNLVIHGNQEVRVNHEVRQLTVQGVVRPGDIGEQNSISSERIAEARISYGGRGLISDVQQPRVGNQIVDILSPW